MIYKLTWDRQFLQLATKLPLHLFFDNLLEETPKTKAALDFLRPC